MVLCFTIRLGRGTAIDLRVTLKIGKSFEKKILNERRLGAAMDSCYLSHLYEKVMLTQRMSVLHIQGAIRNTYEFFGPSLKRFDTLASDLGRCSRKLGIAVVRQGRCLCGRQSKTGLSCGSRRGQGKEREQREQSLEGGVVPRKGYLVVGGHCAPMGGRAARVQEMQARERPQGKWGGGVR